MFRTQERAYLETLRRKAARNIVTGEPRLQITLVRSSWIRNAPKRKSAHTITSIEGITHMGDVISVFSIHVHD